MQTFSLERADWCKAAPMEINSLYDVQRKKEPFADIQGWWNPTYVLPEIWIKKFQSRVLLFQTSLSFPNRTMDTDGSRRRSLAISALLNDQSVDPLPSPSGDRRHHAPIDQQANDYFDLLHEPLSTASSPGISVEQRVPDNQSSAEDHHASSSSSATTGSGPTIIKAKRKRIKPEQLQRLTQVFELTDTPSSEMREKLAEELNMTKREVQVVIMVH